MELKQVSTFRERFTELINDSPKSRTAIAADLGVVKQTVSAWVTGQSSPRFPVSETIARYFGVSVMWLLGFDTDKYPDNSVFERYSKYYFDSVDASKKLGFIGSDEAELIQTYRSLTPRGKTLLVDRSKELLQLHGKKSENNPAKSV